MTPQRPAPAGVPGFRHRQGRLGEPRTARHTLSRSAAFWVTVAMMVLFIYASAAATPLYGVYQAKWGFSAATLTAVFAIYMLFLLATLLVFGSLSDHIGRRPLIMAAIAVNVAAFVLAAVMPETGARRPGALASLRPQVSVPRPARGAFARAVPAVVAVWALGGFYLSLGPSLAAQLSGSRNLLWGGAVVFLLTGVAAAASLAVRGARAPAQMLGGCLALAVGAGVTIAAIETGTAAVLLLGTGIAGLGYGPAFTGAYRTVVALAPEDDRAGLIAAIFTVSYLSTDLPALIAGITTAQYGLHGTALVYSAAVTGLAAAAAGTFLTRHRSRASKPHIRQQLLPHPLPGPCTVPRYPPAAHEEATRYRRYQRWHDHSMTGTAWNAC